MKGIGGSCMLLIRNSERSGEAEEMAQSVQCLLCTPEDLTSDPQSLWKNGAQ